MLLESGAGRAVPGAVRGDTVLASGLVLRAPRERTSTREARPPRAWRSGPRTSCSGTSWAMLKEDDVTTFNIGGAEEGQRARAFQEAVRRAAVYLPSATCFVGPSWVREINRLRELFRSDHKMLLHSRHARVSRLRSTPRTWRSTWSDDSRPASASGNWTVTTCGPWPSRIADFRERQLQRLARFGASHAHGIYEDGRLAHVAWLLPAGSDRARRALEC